jgi:hypothetical protein
MTIFDKERLKKHFSCSFRGLRRVFPPTGGIGRVLRNRLKQEETALKKLRRKGKKTLGRKHDKDLYRSDFHNFPKLLRYL